VNVNLKMTLILIAIWTVGYALVAISLKRIREDKLSADEIDFQNNMDDIADPVTKRHL